MYIYESSGKNKAEAEEQALEDLGLDRDEVIFEAVNSGRSGIFGFVSRKPQMVRVFPREGMVSAEKIIEGTLLTIIKKMGIEAQVKQVGEKEGNIYVEIASEDSGILIGKHGRNLDALQFIINLLVDSRVREGRRVMLDVESYREKRKQSLTRLANSVAARVSRSRQSIALDYMNPYERRIVHLALEDDDRVFTKSDGNGVYKRVRIIPADSARERDLHDLDPIDDDDDLNPEVLDREINGNR